MIDTPGELAHQRHIKRNYPFAERTHPEFATSEFWVPCLNTLYL